MRESGRGCLSLVEGRKGRSSVLEALDWLIAESAPEERPALVVQLAARLAQLGAGLVAPTRMREPDEDPPDRNLSAQETARRLGVSLPFLYRRAKAGEYPFAVRMGRRVVFSAHGLAAWSRQRMNRERA
jgi:excisionase family DNA binding protein